MSPAQGSTLLLLVQPRTVLGGNAAAAPMAAVLTGFTADQLLWGMVTCASLPAALRFISVPCIQAQALLVHARKHSGWMYCGITWPLNLRCMEAGVPRYTAGFPSSPRPIEETIPCCPDQFRSICKLCSPVASTRGHAFKQHLRAS